MSTAEDHHGFNVSEIPMWIHSIWLGLIGLIWKGKSIGKAVVGVVTVDARLSEVEARVLKIEQTPQVSRGDIDTLRSELQGTLQSNQAATLSEIRFLFSEQDKRNDKRYEPIDDIIRKLKDKV